MPHIINIHLTTAQCWQCIKWNFPINKIQLPIGFPVTQFDVVMKLTNAYKRLRLLYYIILIISYYIHSMFPTC